MGVPVIANAGVGDVAEVLEESGAGVVVDSFDPTSLRHALDAASRLGLTRAQIREAALRWFNLADGVEKYNCLYQQLLLNRV